MARKRAKNIGQAEAAASKAKGRKRKASTGQEDAEAIDPLNQCVTLCQEQRWREALMLCRRLCGDAEDAEKRDLYASLAGAQVKIEYSLRRQMAAALISETKTMLTKEYLLDVGE